MATKMEIVKAKEILEKIREDEWTNPEEQTILEQAEITLENYRKYEIEGKEPEKKEVKKLRDYIPFR